jgi:low affinity Fe/Cu permease
MSVSRAFSSAAEAVAHATGRPLTFALCVVLVIIWAVSGPYFHFSDTWQLVINTGTTIVTFLMVFLIQNTQNRDGAAIQAKLDELIRASAAQNTYIGIEHLTEEELNDLRQRCETRAKAERLGKAKDAANKAQEKVHLKAVQAADRATGSD